MARKRKSIKRSSDECVNKRSRRSDLHTSHENDNSNELDSQSTSIHVEHLDKIETKVDIIVKDTFNNSYRSLTIWGTGLGVEKTIAVVEELKRKYLEQGTEFTQETSIKADDNDEPHLQVVLNLHHNPNSMIQHNECVSLKG